MSHTENILGMLSDRAGTGKDSQIYTPIPIAKDMTNILPEEVWNKDTTFLDPACKSGVFLHEIYLKLMETPSMIQDFPDKAERRKHILQNQLYGISPNGMCQLMSTRTVYGTIQGENNIISFESNYLAVMQNADKTFLYERLKKEFNTMKFDVVIGNPPYNKGMDLDFVDLGYKISNKYTVMITPAKWQTTADDYSGCASKNINYKQFRELYVPHMSYVCFYPNCSDIFDIQERSGITYFLMNRQVNNEDCTVENKSKYQPLLNSIYNRKITNGESLLNIVNEIRQCIGEYESFRFINTQGKYAVNIGKCIRNERGKKDMYQALGIISYSTGKASVLENTEIIEKINNNFVTTIANSEIIFQSNDINECKSFESWITSKFVRFFLLGNISTRSNIFNSNYFRFVPTPETDKFDHIYTDEELYKAFNLPQKYIDVIESVIKERK